MLQTLPAQTELKVIQSPDERDIAHWQQCYPDCWILLDVTQEDEGEPTMARLVAVAREDTRLVPLWQDLAQQGHITAIIYGDSTEPGPSVVASDAS